MPNKIDWDFIHAMEGMVKTGYVPKNKDGSVMGTSGVTIAAGYDLGAHSVAEVKQLKLDPTLEAKLTKYCGLKQKAAVDFLAKNPLSLTDNDCNAIMRPLEAMHAQNVATMYNKGISFGHSFDQLTSGQQTMIASVAYQYGNLPTKTPRLWKDIMGFDWEGAVKELRNFGDAYQPRHNREALLVAKELGIK